MDLLVYLIYPVMLVLLFWGAKVMKRKEWNEEILSLRQTKAIQGFCAVMIMLHHISLTTCDEMVEEEFFQKGLEFFLPVGYLCVAVFLFCSGYGLYKSYRTKEDYMRDFLKNRALLPLVALITSSLVFLATRAYLGERLHMSGPFHVGGVNTSNPYGWYIYAILILYIGFYFAFAYRKNQTLGVSIITAVAAAYIIFCIWWMYGDWWYNTIPLFVIGILVARHEEGFLNGIRKLYFLWVPLTFLLFTLTFLIAENTEETFELLGITAQYEPLQIVYLIAKMTSAVFFVLLVILLSAKVRIGNKALAFMGNITLEFYLLHGLFVQMFSNCFLDKTIDSVYYIRFVPLRIAITFVLSLILAILMQKVNKLLIGVVEFITIQGSVSVLAVQILRILLLVFLVATPYLAYTNHSTTKERESLVKKYEKDHITFVKVDGKKMAAFILGEGEKTIVILPDLGNPCPTIAFRPLAEELGKKYKVVVLDYFGSGFSESTNTSRESEQVAYEIHEALKGLGIEEPVWLMPYENSGIEAMVYTKTYREDVEGILGMDMYVPARMKENMRRMNVKRITYDKIMEREGFVECAGQEFLNAFGYVSLQVPVYCSTFSRTLRSTDIDVVEEMFKLRYKDDFIRPQLAAECGNNLALVGERFDENLPVLFLLDRSSYHEWVYGGHDWNQYYRDMITNEEIQKIEMVSESPDCVYYDRERISREVEKYLGDE